MPHFVKFTQKLAYEFRESGIGHNRDWLSLFNISNNWEKYFCLKREKSDWKTDPGFEKGGER